MANSPALIPDSNAISIYARDPEGNRLEIFIDTPWYVDQPMRVPVDFGLGRRRPHGSC